MVQDRNFHFRWNHAKKKKSNILRNQIDFPPSPFTRVFHRVYSHRPQKLNKSEEKLRLSVDFHGNARKLNDPVACWRFRGIGSVLDEGRDTISISLNIYYWKWWKLELGWKAALQLGSFSTTNSHGRNSSRKYRKLVRCHSSSREELPELSARPVPLL